MRPYATRTCVPASAISTPSRPAALPWRMADGPAAQVRASKRPVQVRLLSDDGSDGNAMDEGAPGSALAAVPQPSAARAGGGAPDARSKGVAAVRMLCSPATVDAPSEDDSDGPTGCQEPRPNVREKMATALRQTCLCGMKRLRRAQRPDTNRHRAKPKMVCTETLRQKRLEECVDQRLAFSRMHKVDQDRLLFSAMLKAIAAASGGRSEKHAPLAYEICGERVCQWTFLRVWGVGAARLEKLRAAAARGDPSPPLDCRFVKKARLPDAPKAASITSFLREVYESEAETLPEEVDSDIDDSCAAAPLFDAAAGGGAPRLVETRHLPPGSIFEYWQLYQKAHPQATTSYRYFLHVWTQDWGNLLKFRGQQQHSICSVCVCHKLLLQQCGHDAVRRAKLLQAFEEHKQAQYNDRRVYWHIRAQARLQPDQILSLIIDGMDQAKFCCPRHPHQKSKDLESMQRPRLRCNACIMHGLEVLVVVSRADFPKSTNVTCEIVAHMLTRARARGLDLRHVKVHLQLDNTSSSNKNVVLLRFLAYLVGAGFVREAEADFLRKGHTHEDIDQFFGMVASWLVRQRYLETPEDFVKAVQRFLDTLDGRPWPQDRAHRRAASATQVHDWKAWLEHAPQLKNHTGPSAPHVFRFARRVDAEALTARSGLVSPVFPGSPHPHDVVLFCKQWMASAEYSQMPIVTMPWSAVHHLFRTGGAPAIAQASRPLTPAYVSHVRKFLPILRRQPYCLNRAAAHLEGWLNGQLPHAPLLDVSACLPQTGMSCGGQSAVGPRLLGNGFVGDNGQEHVEPACAAVELADGGADPRDDLPSRWAEIVYGVAVPLHVQHRIPWEAALAAGEDSFKSLNATPKRRRLSFQGVRGNIFEPLDVQRM